MFYAARLVVLAAALLALAGCGDGDRGSGPIAPEIGTITCKQSIGNTTNTTVTVDCGDDVVVVPPVVVGGGEKGAE